MRVLLINTSERIGEAAVAASRPMEPLKNNDIKAKLLVRGKRTNRIAVVSLSHNWRMMWKFVWRRIVMWKANRSKRGNVFAVDIANTGTDVITLPEFQQTDIIHLHWINQGMSSLKNIENILASGKPVVWTTRNMWLCTGIRHHARECVHYQQEYHNYPFIYGNGGKENLSYRTFRKKQDLYRGRHINLVTCGHWLEGLVNKSAPLTGHTVTCIPNPINMNLFKPHNKQEACSKCNLPQNAKLVLFGSVRITDKREGIDYLIDSCKLLAEKHPELKEKLGVVVFGKESQQLTNLLPFKVYPLDFVSNEHQLMDIYNAANLLVTPSLEKSLPNVIIEAVTYGIPYVGFNMGGILEMIDHLHNGYVARYRSSEDFANGIYWTLTDPGYPNLCEQTCRRAIIHCSESAIAKKYIDLYSKVTGGDA